MNSLSFVSDFIEIVLKKAGNMLIKKGKKKEIEKLTNAFLKINMSHYILSRYIVYNIYHMRKICRI